jgi:hypothetical protein
MILLIAFFLSPESVPIEVIFFQAVCFNAKFEYNFLIVSFRVLESLTTFKLGLIRQIKITLYLFSL